MKHSISELDPKSAAAVVTAVSDITLLLDRAGTVLEVGLGSEELEALGAERWVGRAWLDTVTVESRDKIEALLKGRLARGPKWRQVNHPVAGERDIPVLYCTQPVGGQGLRIATGRDLRPTAALQQRLLDAQQALEEDYARLRQIDTRYRLLFQTTNEAVLVADAANGTVSEANPASARALGVAEKSIPGRALTELFPTAAHRALQGMLDTVRATGRAETVRIGIGKGGKRRELAVAASLFRQEHAAHVLVRLNPVSGAARDGAEDTVGAHLNTLIERLPDCFVVTDPTGRILASNSAFLDAAQLGTFEQARGQPLDRWLGQSPVDLRVLLGNLQQHGSVRVFASTLRGELGFTSAVEVSAVAAVDAETPSLAFVIRDVHRPTARDAVRSPALPAPAANLSELIGRVSLKDLVRESTDMIERLCIEAALELTGDNRASAAEMLGLSRQSLYIKLRRHGLGNLETTEES